MDSRRTKRPRNQDASTSQPVANHTPWPRPEETAFIIDRTFDDVPRKILQSGEVVKRTINHEWDDYDSLFYNEWLHVPISPTRYSHPRTMSGMKIKDGVNQLLDKAGLRTIASRTNDLYPDLVRQFFASIRMFCGAVDPEQQSNARHWFLSFMASGIRYNVSAQDICEIYGFATDRFAQELPESIVEEQDFWGHIGVGIYNAHRSATHTDIRHPILRYLVRLFATTFLYRVEPGKFRKSELVLLSYALRDQITNPVWDELAPNMGMVFARHLYSLRTTPLTSSGHSGKTFAAGNLLTPLFQFCGVDLSGYKVDKTRLYMDVDYLQRATWLKPDLHWVFPIAPGQQRMVQLPLPELMQITEDPTLLLFEPDERLLRSVGPARRQVTRGTAGASTSRAPQQLDGLPPTPAIPMDEFQTWVVQSLQTIWRTISNIPRCGCVRPRPPSLQRSSSEEED